jgi:hypothetical protein
MDRNKSLNPKGYWTIWTMQITLNPTFLKPYPAEPVSANQIAPCGLAPIYLDSILDFKPDFV